MKKELSTNKTLCLTYNEERLKKIYDVCNKLFKDKDECFYTSQEVEQLKRDKTNKFI